jgi:hypothetical protein
MLASLTFLRWKAIAGFGERRVFAFCEELSGVLIVGNRAILHNLGSVTGVRAEADAIRRWTDG